MEGRPTEKLSDMYIKLAKGGVGAIITGLIGVQRNGRSNFHMCMMDNDNLINDYKKINNMLNEYGVPLIAQLAHGGGQCDRIASGGFNLAPSKKYYGIVNKFSQVLSEKDIIAIIDSYINAIERAKKAGFAGVQLHAAHAYLLSEFLTGGLNSRKDKWGGSTENRFRIISEIMKGARDRVGSYPILAKFSAYDNLKNGIREDEAVQLAIMFQKAGIDALEVSCGANDGLSTIRTKNIPYDAILDNKFKIKSEIMKVFTKKLIPLLIKRYDPIYNFNVDIAEKIKQNIDIPVIVVGGIRNINDINSMISEKKADYVSMCRPFIIEPDLVNKFREGKRDTSKCIDCCYCMFRKEGTPVKCYYGRVQAS
jgi:2,4-dienoyl-CoA reductase-like NADH-dependent reductase (Old Yellow Enzyme family)